MNSEKMLRMEQLVKELTYHTQLYNYGEEVISDTEWDRMYFELKSLEKELGITSIHSPTQSIIFDEPLDHLNKIQFDENYLTCLHYQAHRNDLGELNLYILLQLFHLI